MLSGGSITSAAPIAPGKTLRLETLTSATVHWSDDGWRTVHDRQTKNMGSVFIVPNVGGTVEFTFYWNEAEKWENTDFAITISEA